VFHAYGKKSWLPAQVDSVDLPRRNEEKNLRSIIMYFVLPRSAEDMMTCKQSLRGQMLTHCQPWPYPQSQPITTTITTTTTMIVIITITLTTTLIAEYFHLRPRPKASVHGPDTHEETVILAEMFLNDNSVQYMNKNVNAACEEVSVEVGKQLKLSPVNESLYLLPQNLMLDTGIPPTRP